MDKELLRQAIIAKLSEDLEVLTRAAHMAREEATDDESKAENKYDTHAIEAGYLAGSQARLAADLAESISFYKMLSLSDYSSGDAIDIGAVVGLSSRDGVDWYFLGPRNGGLEVTCEEKSILVITPQSPLGRQLMGRRNGDTIVTSSGVRSASYKISQVI
jgi:transcription elongation GreA/GreB family factor